MKKLPRHIQEVKEFQAQTRDLTLEQKAKALDQTLASYLELLQYFQELENYSAIIYLDNQALRQKHNLPSLEKELQFH